MLWCFRHLACLVFDWVPRGPTNVSWPMAKCTSRAQWSSLWSLSRRACQLERRWEMASKGPQIEAVMGLFKHLPIVQGILQIGKHDVHTIRTTLSSSVNLVEHHPVYIRSCQSWSVDSITWFSCQPGYFWLATYHWSGHNSWMCSICY